MKISIAIPCYEMQGFGDGFLQYSLNVLREQTFKDFEVVVSDHSVDDKIKDVCFDSFNSDLNIKYIRNENNRGSSSANANNCIKHSEGELIKILCQDDYMFGKDAIQKTVDAFDYEKKWLTASYVHTENREYYRDIIIPRPELSGYINNRIGTHSCLTILNDSPHLFDENLIWFMDCEYYYRLYFKYYGQPVVLREPTVAQFIWWGQVTNTMIDNNIILREQGYILGKHEGKEYE